MTVLIAYSTLEGQTRKIARFIDDVATDTGHNTILIDTGELIGQGLSEEVDRVILAAPVHERRHPKPFELFIEEQRGELAARRSLVLSVSLMAAFPEGQEDARDYLTEMLMRTHFEPDATALISGAVRPENYEYFEKEILRHVVLRDQIIDPKYGAQEFTDWGALKATVMTFLND